MCGETAFPDGSKVQTGRIERGRLAADFGGARRLQQHDLRHRREPGQQTVNDITGLVNINGGNKNGAIDYKPRPPIVAPPPTAALPPPGTHDVASGGDWPKDPDAAVRARKAAGAHAMTGNAKIDAQYDPDLGIPAAHDNAPHIYDANKDAPGVKEAGSAAQDAEIRKLIANAKTAVSRRRQRQPIRKTLSEPPVVYRAPDPNAPTEFKSAKKSTGRGRRPSRPSRRRRR